MAFEAFAAFVMNRKAGITPTDNELQPFEEMLKTLTPKAGESKYIGRDSNNNPILKTTEVSLDPANIKFPYNGSEISTKQFSEMKSQLVLQHFDQECKKQIQTLKMLHQGGIRKLSELEKEYKKYEDGPIGFNIGAVYISEKSISYSRETEEAKEVVDSLATLRRVANEE